jgi:hypothetical protein
MVMTKCETRGRLAPWPALALALLLPACAESNHYVIASSATVIGVELSQDPATQTPRAKLGYNRAELALVPTNKGACVRRQDADEFVCTGYRAGARDSAEVLMELRYSGIFSTSESAGIYQRLAVGEAAVRQPGASVMFAKDAAGRIDAETAAALRAVLSVPAPNLGAEVRKHALVAKFIALHDARDSAELQKFEAAAKAVGFPRSGLPHPDYPAFRDFAADGDAGEAEQVRRALEAQGVRF